MKELLLGNQAVARGLYEAGCTVVSAYPGTPSTEITEAAAKFEEMYCEWAPNEKVATEVASGAALSGARSFCAMKHVGLNVAADPLFTMSYIGVNGGMVIGVADDPGMHSSQNEQDSRYYAIASKVPMLEPSDAEECKSFVSYAFDISEKFDTPVLLRLTTRVAHSRSLVELCNRTEIPLKEYNKDPQKTVMMPANAIKRHVVVEERLNKLKEYAETTPLNKCEINSTKIGVICSGITYEYAHEALGEKASYLKIGLSNPLPEKMIKDFASKVEKLYVMEELDPIIENFCKQIGVNVIGKDTFTLLGEYSQNMIREKVLGETILFDQLEEMIPPRPPALCSGCPHRPIFYILNKIKAFVSGDIGCYTLGAIPPLSSLDSCICMGASISALHGINKARGDEYVKNAVAVIGDSTFIHSGITGLIDIAYNKGVSTVIVLDNSITGMTGHQQNPTTGLTIRNDPTVAVNLEALAKAVGIERVRVVDPYNMDESEKVIKEEMAVNEPSLIISRRPCVLLKKVKKNPPLKINKDKCVGCKSCMKIGCPSISIENKKASIDFTQCVGCGVCKTMCKFNAIED